jgi:hypothetical protein
MRSSMRSTLIGRRTRPVPAPGKVVRLERREQCRPRYELLHLGDEAVSAGQGLLGRKLRLGKRQLLHRACRQQRWS